MQYVYICIRDWQNCRFRTQTLENFRIVEVFESIWPISFKTNSIFLISPADLLQNLATPVIIN